MEPIPSTVWVIKNQRLDSSYTYSKTKYYWSERKKRKEGEREGEKGVGEGKKE